MIYTLDTNICIYALKGSFPGIAERISTHPPASIKIPSIVKAELLLGGEKSVHRRQVLPVIEKFLTPFEILPFGDTEAVFYAQIRSELEQSGRTIGPNDLIIAATTIANNSVLVTHNVKEFSRVRSLPIEDWATSR